MSVFLCNSKANKCHRPFKKNTHRMAFASFPKLKYWGEDQMQNEGGRMFRQKSIVKGNKKSPIQTKQERWNMEPKTQEHTGIQKDKHQEPKVNRAARERTWKHNLTKRNTQVKTSRARLTITKEGETARKLEADTHQKTNLQWKQEVPKKQILNTEPRRLREQSKRTITLREEQTGNHRVWRFKHTKIKIKN